MLNVSPEIRECPTCGARHHGEGFRKGGMCDPCLESACTAECIEGERLDWANRVIDSPYADPFSIREAEEILAEHALENPDPYEPE